MRARTIILIALVVLLGAGTMFLINEWLSEQEAAMRAEQTREVPDRPAPKILVAALDLPSGHFLRPQDVRWQEWPNDSIPGNYMRRGVTNPQSLVGAVIRQGVTEGQPITNSVTVRPGDHGFLAAVLWPGTRAVSVGVNATSGVSGLVYPGDRVDIILTRSLRVQQGSTRRTLQSSETVLRNVRIIAIDQSTNDQQQAARVPDTVTLELTPEQAEMIVLAQQMGRLSLSLRSLSPQTERDMARQVAEDEGTASANWNQVLEVGGRPDADKAEPDSGASAESTNVSSDGETPSVDPNGRPTPRHELGERGSTITRDYHVSRMGFPDGRESGNAVIVIRGPHAQRLIVRGNRLESPESEQNSGTEETESGDDE